MTPELVYPGSPDRFNVTLGGNAPPLKAISAREAQYPMAVQALKPSSSGVNSAFCVSSLTLRQPEKAVRALIITIPNAYLIAMDSGCSIKVTKFGGLLPT